MASYYYKHRWQYWNITLEDDQMRPTERSCLKIDTNVERKEPAQWTTSRQKEASLK